MHRVRLGCSELLSSRVGSEVAMSLQRAVGYHDLRWNPFSSATTIPAMRNTASLPVVLTQVWTTELILSLIASTLYAAMFKCSVDLS